MSAYPQLSEYQPSNLIGLGSEVLYLLKCSLPSQLLVDVEDFKMARSLIDKSTDRRSHSPAITSVIQPHMPIYLSLFH